jgi:hypothetical protein
MASSGAVMIASSASETANALNSFRLTVRHGARQYSNDGQDTARRNGQQPNAKDQRIATSARDHAVNEADKAHQHRQRGGYKREQDALDQIQGKAEIEVAPRRGWRARLRDEHDDKRGDEHKQCERRANADHTPHQCLPLSATNCACSV